jgi:hypothetical protein
VNRVLGQGASQHRIPGPSRPIIPQRPNTRLTAWPEIGPTAMGQDISSVNGALERRIGLMRELANSLERAQAAVLNSDRVQLSRQTMRQRELCEQWRLLVSEFTRNVSVPPRRAHAVPNSHQAAELGPTGERHRALIVELAQIEARVAHLNRAYGALLRRARRTVDIFCRVLANSGLTYSQPTLQPASTNQPHSRG